MAASGSRAVHFIDLQPGTARRIGPPRLLRKGNDCGIGFSKDGQVITQPIKDGALVFHRDHPERAIRLGPQADVRYVAISPDGRFVATGSHGHAGGLKVWETERGRLVKELPRAVFLDAAAAFSPGGRLLAVHGREGGRILTVGTREEGPAIPAGLAAFAPDGSLLAVDAGQGLIRLLDPATGRDKAHLEDPNQDTGSLLVKPDGTRLVAVSDDGKAIHVWDLQRIREELVQLDLDWNAPPYPKRADPAPGPLEIRVVAAE